jgi:hypothetical protein
LKDLCGVTGVVGVVPAVGVVVDVVVGAGFAEVGVPPAGVNFLFP